MGQSGILVQFLTKWKAGSKAMDNGSVVETTGAGMFYLLPGEAHDIRSVSQKRNLPGIIAQCPPWLAAPGFVRRPCTRRIVAQKSLPR